MGKNTLYNLLVLIESAYEAGFKTGEKVVDTLKSYYNKDFTVEILNNDEIVMFDGDGNCVMRFKADCSLIATEEITAHHCNHKLIINE